MLHRWVCARDDGRRLGRGPGRDAAVGTRFDTLTRELGDAFVGVELPGKKHSTLTAHRRQEAVDRVLEFFRSTLL